MTFNMRKELNMLGTLTPDKIARLLETKGIKAIRGSSSRCAIAQHLINQSPEYAVAVSGDEVVVFGTTMRDYLQVPETVGQFIRKFDLGCYPQLLADNDQGRFIAKVTIKAEVSASEDPVS